MEPASNGSAEVVSPSLLTLGKRKCSPACCERFDLAPEGWGDDTENQQPAHVETPPAKKGKRLSVRRNEIDKAVTIGDTRWTFVSDARRKHLQQNVFPRTLLSAQNGRLETSRVGVRDEIRTLSMNQKSRCQLIWTSLTGWPTSVRTYQ